MNKITKLFLITLLFFSTSANALTLVRVPKTSIEIISTNSDYVFVMLYPASKNLEFEEKRFIKDKVDDIRRINKTYPKSGMYINDGSVELLWSVDWNDSGVLIANDGVHLIRPGRASIYIEDENNEEYIAFMFYKNGKKTKEYKIGDLTAIKKPSKPILTYPPTPAVKPYPQLWYKEVFFDRDNLKYYVTTKTNEQLIFDVTTGDIINR